MATIICEHCKSEVNIPEGYNAPYIKCNMCGIHLKTGVVISKNKKFNVISPSSNNVAKISVYDKANDIEDNAGEPNSESPSPITASPSISDKYQRILDGIGEDGKKKAFDLVSEYICKSSSKARAASRAKAIQTLMREKFPLALAAGAIEYAEQSPEVLALGKSKNIRKAIIVVVVAVLIIAGALSLL